MVVLLWVGGGGQRVLSHTCPHAPPRFTNLFSRPVNLSSNPGNNICLLPFLPTFLSPYTIPLISLCLTLTTSLLAAMQGAESVFGCELLSTLMKKKIKIFLIYKEIQMGAVAKSYMRKGFLIF
jgi:hypothetical protein